jgi:hypothetical protein
LLRFNAPEIAHTPEQVKVLFMPVGHTHAQVDQMFSCVSKALRGHNLFTVDHLHGVIKGSFKPEIYTDHLRSVVDIRSWIAPDIRGMDLHGHSKQQHFKIAKEGGAGPVYLWYKKQAREEWKGRVKLLNDRQRTRGQDVPPVVWQKEVENRAQLLEAFEKYSDLVPEGTRSTYRAYLAKETEAASDPEAGPQSSGYGLDIIELPPELFLSHTFRVFEVKCVTREGVAGIESLAAPDVGSGASGFMRLEAVMEAGFQLREAAAMNEAPPPQPMFAEEEEAV